MKFLKTERGEKIVDVLICITVVLMCAMTVFLVCLLYQLINLK